MQNMNKDLYKKLYNEWIFKGEEARINLHNNELYKTFYILPSPSCATSLSDQYLNKRKKLEIIMDIPNFSTINKVYPLELYNVYNKFASYSMPNTIDFIRLDKAKIPNFDKIDILKKYRQILDYFHTNDLVFCDIKSSNLLISEETGEVSFCDIDNMKVKDLNIDLLPTCSSYFLYLYGNVDDKIDSYIFNLFTMEFLLDLPSFNYESILDFLDENYIPYFSSNMDKVKIKSIFKEMKRPDSSYSGKYIIDYMN